MFQEKQNKTKKTHKNTHDQDKTKIKRSTIFAALLKHKNAKQWDTSAKTHCT